MILNWPFKLFLNYKKFNNFTNNKLKKCLFIKNKFKKLKIKFIKLIKLYKINRNKKMI